MLIPRLNAWYGDDNTDYGYSGIQLDSQRWTKELYVLKDQVQEFTGERFNSVLLNWYRDGSDSVAWHSDDEKELGLNPVIASLSLGQTRQFSLRHKTNKSLPTTSIDLAGGSLLLMKGETQHNWEHCIAKTKKPVKATHMSFGFYPVCCLSESFACNENKEFFIRK